MGVRCGAAAARYTAEVPDLVRLAGEASVDLALPGTLMRAGQHISVDVQVVEAPSHTLAWSHTTQATLHDVLQLKDDVVQQSVALDPQFRAGLGAARSTRNRATRARDGNILAPWAT